MLKNNVKAVIFDMDGTMINNMPYHEIAWKEFCNKKGLKLTKQDFKKKISGKKNKEIFQTIFSNTLSPQESQKLAEEKEQIYRGIYKDKIKEIPGLRDLINKLKRKNIPLAIATTAPIKNREFALKMLNITSADFAVIVGDEDVKKGKPDPEIYLKTAELIGIKPNNCLVFEDSPVGVESAKRAGMKVIALSTSHNNNELQKADFIVEDFRNIENLLKKI